MNVELATPREHFSQPGRYIQRSGKPINTISESKLPTPLTA